MRTLGSERMKGILQNENRYSFIEKKKVRCRVVFGIEWCISVKYKNVPRDLE